jgi:uncharacterized membrane protein YhaH (DUF805 family)
MLAAFKRYFDFQGRSSRSEYWLFYLFTLLVAIGLAIGNAVVLGVTGSQALNVMFAIAFVLFYLAVLIPSLAVSFRRLHDTGRSAWWLLIAFLPFIGALVLLYFFVLASSPGPNRFGPQPGASAEDLQQTFA